MTARITRRELNRATLHRQLLLDRRPRDVVEAIERILGLNAQQANDPFLALHARLDGFARGDLDEAIERDEVVRACLMRGTQHLVSARDYRWLRPLLTPLLTRLQRSVFHRRTGGSDPDELATDARRILAGCVLPRPEVGRALARTRPDADTGALGWSVQHLVPVVHPAPNGTWDARGAVLLALAEDRVGPLEEADPRRLVRRYLAAFGPATAADVRTWSGVAGSREVVDGMRDELRPFRDEDGRELVDLPDAPRPDPATPAPVRLLADFDELLLAHADRSRLMTDEVRARVCVPDEVHPTLLVDGAVVGTWELDRSAGVVTIRPFQRLSRADASAAVAEGYRMLAFAAADHESHEVRVLEAS